MALLLDIQFAPKPSTSFWTIFIIVSTKGADIFAYLVGKTFGKHMLCPRLSPKKTVEGALGGLLGSTIITWILVVGDPLARVALGLFVGFFAIAGDLFESIFKRDAQLKDSGHIPGLGGALDLIDSLLFTTPVVYLYLVSQEII
jgi:phosphatidate cytidylyltransferase